MTHPQPQTTSVLEEVPDEIWHGIFMHLALDHPQLDGPDFPTDGPHPLLPVVQVSKRFNTIASPLLVAKWHPKPTRPSGAKFVLHLLKHPQLRSRVKHLTMDVIAFSAARPKGKRASLYNRWPSTFITAAEVEQLVESAEKTCPPLAQLGYDDGKISWTDQIGKRSPDAISALLLAWVTELEELELTFDHDFEECGPDPWLVRPLKLAVGVLFPPPPAVQDNILQPPAMFQKLHCVTVWRYEHDPMKEGSNAAFFFRLPSLRVFKAYAMDAAALTLDEPDPSSGTALQPLADQLFPKGTSNVEEIHLYRSWTTENGLGVLTRACRCLRVLALQWENSGNYSGMPSGFSGRAMVDAIKLHSASLEEISIDTTGYSEEFFEDYISPEILGDCLLRCDKLERLTINLEVLYEYREAYEENSSSFPLSSVLPPGLTSLGLSFVPRRAEALRATKDNVLELLHQCGPNGQFSRLKRLQITDFTTEFDTEGDIVVMARKAGVELTLHAERTFQV